MMRAREFWTPEYWRRYCESANPFRQYKQERDRSLAIELLKPQDGELVLEDNEPGLRTAFELPLRPGQPDSARAA